MSESKEITTGNGGREVAHHEERGITASQRLALIKEALINPDVAPEKAAAMMELTFKLEDRQARADFIAAKVAAIAEMPSIGKDGQNTHTGSRYATWERMQPLITPILSRHGLVLTFEVGHEGPRVTVAPVLSGHGWEERGGAIVLPADTGKGRNDVQAVGSSVQYGKRYAAMAMLNLIAKGLAEDDDGNAGGGTPLDPYEALTDQERAWVDEGRLQAKEGVEAYSEWFKADKHRAGFLAYNKAGNGQSWHDQNKACAAAVDGN